MTNIAYWVPQDAPASQNTLIYVIAHASREAAKKNWDEFRGDPEWQKVQKDSEANVSQRQDREQGGIRVHGSDRIFAGEAATGGCATRSTRPGRVNSRFGATGDRGIARASTRWTAR